MTKDEILAELRKLSEAWKATADKERWDIEGPSFWVDMFTKELDELIERASAE